MNAGLYVLSLIAAGVVIAWILGKIVDFVEDRNNEWHQDWDR